MSDARLYLLALRRPGDDDAVGELPAPFAAAPVDPDLPLVVNEVLTDESEDGARWRAKIDERYPSRMLLSAEGSIREVMGGAPEAIEALLGSELDGAVLDVLSGRLIAGPLAIPVLTSPEIEALVRVAIDLRSSQDEIWLASRGLRKLGRPEVAISVPRDALHEGAYELVHLLARRAREERLDADDEVAFTDGFRLSLAAVDDDAATVRQLADEEAALAPILGPEAVDGLAALAPRVLQAFIRTGGGEDATSAYSYTLLDELRENEDESERPEREHFERTWTEREDLLEQTFGPTHPPGSEEGQVLAVPPGHPLRTRFPGLCIYVYRPDPENGREDWLYVTHGPTQPPSIAETSSTGRSGSGFELGMRVREPGEWVPQAILALLHYSLIAEPPLGQGHRVAFSIIHDDEQRLRPVLSLPTDLDEGERLAGDAAGLLLWPTLDPWRGFKTSTGAFHILMATAITQPEWELARETSSVHLLNLLHLAGVEQRCDPLRSSVTADPGMMERWHEVAALDENAAFEALYSAFAKGPAPDED